MFSYWRVNLLVLFVVTAGLLSVSRPDHTETLYIEKYKDLAIAEMQRSGIPVSIKLAQALVESNSGRSVLADRANNHFGIKCKSYWTGPRYFYADDDKDGQGRLVPSCFRMYDSPRASFMDHTDFLMSSERYSRLFDYAHDDYVSWAHGLKQSGYATDPGYANKLIRVIDRYDLDRWDGNDK
jgi:flagellum-specific peptidoglycan hydrolase FlgJ